jgi:hypothetical protein
MLPCLTRRRKIRLRKEKQISDRAVGELGAIAACGLLREELSMAVTQWDEN